MDTIVPKHAWAQVAQVADFDFGAGPPPGRIGGLIGAATHFVVDHTFSWKSNGCISRVTQPVKGNLGSREQETSGR